MLSPALLLSVALTLAAAPSTGLLTSSRDDDSLGLREGRRFPSSTSPSSARLVSGTDWGMVGGGLALLLGGYIPSAALGALLIGDPLLIVPVLGPFIHLLSLSSGGQRFHDLSSLAWAFLGPVYTVGVLLLGGAQLAGAILILAGAGKPRTVRGRDVHVAVAPGAGGAPLGASVLGRF